MSVPSTEVYRTPDERFAGLPEYPLAPRYATVDGLRMHYVDEGTGPPCLLLHGEPTWSYIYRKFIPVLVADGRRVVAPDYFGFGRSDKPTRLADYSYEGHVRALRSFVQSLDLQSITLVVHDWGGPIGLRLATLEPKRIARLVVLDTGLYTRWTELPKGLKQWRSFVATQPDLEIGQLVSRGCVKPLSAAVAAAYDAPFPNRASKAGARAFPMLIPETLVDPGASEMIETVQRLARYRWPTLVMWADRDPAFPLSVGRSVAALFAGAEVNVIEQSGHLLQEDSGPQIAQKIVVFLHSSW